CSPRVFWRSCWLVALPRPSRIGIAASAVLLTIKRWPRWGRLTNLPSYPTDRLWPNGLSSTVPVFRSEWVPDFTVVAAASALAKLLEHRQRANISDSHSALMAN